MKRYEYKVVDFEKISLMGVKWLNKEGVYGWRLAWIHTNDKGVQVVLEKELP